MSNSKFFPPLRLLAAATVFLLLACSPTLDWREVQGRDASFSVLLPAKPASQSRQIELAGVSVNMSMTSASVAGVTYAVASARMPGPAAVAPALDAMKTALVRNIGGTVRKEAPAAVSYGPVPATDLEAVGRSSPRPDSAPVVLFARFAAKGLNVYQAAVVGPEAAVTRDAVDTFLSSFKPS